MQLELLELETNIGSILEHLFITNTLTLGHEI